MYISFSPGSQPYVNTVSLPYIFSNSLSLELTKEKEAAQLEAINSRIENAMLRKGIKDEKVERAVRLVDKKNRLLVCYLLKSIDAPMTRQMLNDAMQEDGLANFFEVGQAIEELLKTFPELIEKPKEENIGFKIGGDGKQDKPESEMEKMRKVMGLK